MSLSAVSQIHSPLKAVVTSVKGTMQMQQLLDIISVTVVSIVRFALIEHTSLVADPQLDTISKFTEIDGKIQHPVAPNHRVALSKVEP